MTNIKRKRSMPAPVRAEADPNGLMPGMAGAKLDYGKVCPDLILDAMSLAVLEVSKVATFGAQKYSENGWVAVPDGIKRYRRAGDRHRLQGATEIIDRDSGLMHQAHLAWNALAVLELMLRQEASGG